MRLIFWNCGIAPALPGNRKPKKARQIDDVCRVVAALFEDGVDGIALCEVDCAAMGSIRESLGLRGPFADIDLTHKIGRSRWDLGFVYRRGALRCTKGEPALFTERGERLRGGHGVKVECDRPFYLFLSHWRSRFPGKSNQAQRMQQARGLWRVIRQVISDGKLVVLMGDFNDEPFDASMNEVLFTTRDPQLAVEKNVPILYNPTWHLLAPAVGASAFGTSEYKGDGNTYRHTLQQALVSARFLNRDSQQAPETRVHPVRFPYIRDEHYPLELRLPI